MSFKYEQQLEDIIARQKEEITRLLKENAELKLKYEALSRTSGTLEDLKKCVDNMYESARAAGQEEVWKLAQKLVLYERDGGFSIDELEEIFETQYWTDVFLLTYSEVTEKIAEWKKAKEEICVGDVVECEGSYGVVIGAGEVYVKGFTSDWTPFQWIKRSCTKTGRHVDIASMLSQIGEDNA